MRIAVILQMTFIVLIAAVGKIQAQPGADIPDPGEALAAFLPNRHPDDNTYKNYFITDSAWLYRWNITTSDWDLDQVQFYSYTNGRLTGLLTKNYQTGANVALSEYTYNSTGSSEASVNYTWAGSWSPSTRYLNEYDSQGRTVSVRLQKWVDGQWMEDRLQQNYRYDASGRLTGYESIFWRNSAWTLPTVIELSYNQLGQLEYHLATRPGGNIDYRMVYWYNEKGLLTRFYTQYPSGDGWSNWNLRSFQYNPCGGRSSQEQFTGEGPDWIPSTRTVFFTSFNFELFQGRKLPVCHKGHTIWIPVQAVPAHLAHGDCIGECTDERDKPYGNDQKSCFTLYPNPARERFTVRFADDCNCSEVRIVLNDFSGNLVRSYFVNDNSPLIIERGNLKSGHYFVGMVGHETFSQAIILE
ncbi:MAG: T9SS type A sorting domain-containing protein [Bacteroidales bacterium]|nr:T9SS type A sorting domain-containing protein [Bacteroidales bacterium]